MVRLAKEIGRANRRPARGQFNKYSHCPHNLLKGHIFAVAPITPT
jgi:hypothetical protein